VATVGKSMVAVFPTAPVAVRTAKGLGHIGRTKERGFVIKPTLTLAVKNVANSILLLGF
jgi:hypothetical protein